jgi:hypothetical protein
MSMPYSLSLLSSYHYFDNTSKEASFCPSSVYVIMVCLSPSPFSLFHFLFLSSFYSWVFVVFIGLGNSEACMVGSPLHAKVFCGLLLS